MPDPGGRLTEWSHGCHAGRRTGRKPFVVPGQSRGAAPVKHLLRSKIVNLLDRKCSGHGRRKYFELLQPFVECSEFESREELPDLCLVPWLEAELANVDVQRDIVEQVAELFVNPHLPGMLFDGIAQFGCELVRMGNDLFDITVLIDQLGCGFIADAANAGKIIGALALQSHEVRPFFGWYPVTLEYRIAVIADHIGDPAPRHDDRDLIADELENVAVPGDDHHFH